MRRALILAISLIFVAAPSLANDPLSLSALTSSTDETGETTYSLSLQILVLMSVITVLPSIVLGMTAFTRIIIVLSILRQALGTQQTPPNQVLIAIALFLTATVMTPTLTKVYDEALTPYLEENMTAEDAILAGGAIIKEFMVLNTREDALVVFLRLKQQRTLRNECGYPLLGYSPRLHNFGTQDCISDRLPDIPSVLGHRHGDLLHSNVIGHDDAVAHAHLTSIQAALVCAR